VITAGKGRRTSCAALFAAAVAIAGSVDAAGLEVAAEDGAVLAQLTLDPGEEWCLHWRHSVTGGPVADCFRLDADGGMVLTRSYLHDFAAGLGHLPGRGVQRAAAGGGYWIEAIDEPVPGCALRLRVGAPAVDHRLRVGETELPLSEIAAGQRVTLRPSGAGVCEPRP
jgi:hypothetical protein